jgi:hypothetical protein
MVMSCVQGDALHSSGSSFAMTSAVIDDLLKRPRGAPVMLPENADDAKRPSVPGSAPDVADDTGRSVRVATGRL